MPLKRLTVSKEWLEQKYIVEKLSTYDLGKILKCDPKTIYSKLVKYGIPTRRRGENLRSEDNYMQMQHTNPFYGRTHSKKTKEILSQSASVPKPLLRGTGNGMYNRKGVLNHRYIDGSSPERQRLYCQSEWLSVERKVLKRDKYKCRRCGSPKKCYRGLHVHHLKSWAGNPDLRYELTNLVTLCNKCHNWVHSKLNVNKELIL